MKVLCTGGAGFIGSNLCISLREQGHQVHVVDDLSTGHKHHLRELHDMGCKVTVCDYGDGATHSLIYGSNFDVVFHVGAIPRVQYSIEHPAETDNNNVFKTLKLLEACVNNVGRVVFSSSSAVAGSTRLEYPSPEDIVKAPLSPYAQQKSTVEEYCKIFGSLYGLDTTCLRYFNVYGPKQYGNSPYSTVISAWCQAIRDGRPLRIDGDGSQSRDFCYVDNVVQANILAATSQHKFNGDVFNIAHGECHTVNDVLELFKTRFNDLNIVYAQPRVGDVHKTHADITKARSVLKYVPNIMFTEGLTRTWDWWASL